MKQRKPQFEFVDGVFRIYGDHLVTDDPHMAKWYEQQGIEVFKRLEGGKRVYYVGREAVNRKDTPS